MKYIDHEVDWFDYCQSDTWSNLWIDDFFLQLGHDRANSKMDVYWCQPGKSFCDGLHLMSCDADIVLMIVATVEHKNLVLLVDHDADIVLLNASQPPSSQLLPATACSS
ncbi:hypothetical protein VPH35_015872 [Triticum aestivum]|uniref:PB1-like domain-containing protein n=1 Tax=Aegilops tauschii subsp. strangulata TaxID=200361 RepID=A0A452XG45_AEGTS